MKSVNLSLESKSSLRIQRYFAFAQQDKLDCHSELCLQSEESQNKLIVYCYFKALSLNLPCHSEPALAGEESLIDSKRCFTFPQHDKGGVVILKLCVARLNNLATLSF
ncbi:hypothetical protein [Helicobacter sp. MIT 14-3879]|uniref:hypothetical protein n=1 Tax=Helicobacter sp. MIT 14-3879 TaxID=2040649 RepID=UPI000E1EF440|nr:hypothetical protein [Helicobacter sp. MIT 14-3879]RDU64082.1 hypothetical protein CQA44_03920 [Helicobacter sp. MIT 14-3879]